jgi:hypothetical protein
MPEPVMDTFCRYCGHKSTFRKTANGRRYLGICQLHLVSPPEQEQEQDYAPRHLRTSTI